MLIINLIEMYTNLMLQVYGIFLTNEKILVLDVVVFSTIKKTTLAAFLHKQPCRASNQFVYYLQMISRLCTRMVEGGACTCRGRTTTTSRCTLNGRGYHPLGMEQRPVVILKWSNVPYPFLCNGNFAITRW